MKCGDDPHFNAGRGSVFTYEGRIEMDAAIMDGRDRNAGAVTGVTATRNPISLARAVMVDSPHVFLSREGADQFSRDEGLPQEPPAYFEIAERRRQVEELRARPQSEQFDVHLKYGTVARLRWTPPVMSPRDLDRGLTGKRWGGSAIHRSSAPLLRRRPRRRRLRHRGGEYFLRIGVAHEIAARMKLSGESAQAAAVAVMAEVKALGGTGGVIVAAPGGEGAFSFNTPGMYRGTASAEGRTVAIYGDE